MGFKALTVNTPEEQEAHILADDDATFYGSIVGGDCVFPVGGEFGATVITNNTVRITDGMMTVGGHLGRIVKGDYEDMTIANGVSGQNRNDLIVARFISGGTAGADDYRIVVVQGTPGETATDPPIVQGDLYNGDVQRDFPLWRVRLNGLSIAGVDKLYSTGTMAPQIEKMVKDLEKKVEDKLGSVVQTSDGKAGMRSDNEGGNFWLKGKSGRHWEADSYNNDQLRVYTDDGKTSFLFDKAGNFFLPILGKWMSDIINTINNNFSNLSNSVSTAINNITSLTRSINILNNIFGVGAAILTKGKTDNLLYGAYDTGFYYYGSNCAGAPSVYTGYMLVLREHATSNMVRVAFSTDGNVYYCVQSADGNVTIGWKAL